MGGSPPCHTSGHVCNTTSIANTPTPFNLCDFMADLHKLQTWRLNLVVIFGTALAIASSLENIFVFCVLVRRRKFRQSSFAYLLALSVCDISLSMVYIPLVTLDKLKDYLASDFLATIWWWCFGFALTSAKVLKSIGAFLMLIITLERYVYCCMKRSKWTKLTMRKRVVGISLACGVAVLTKCTMFLEVQLIAVPCPGYLAYTPHFTDLVEGNLPYRLFSSFVRPTLCVFIPFALMAAMNTAIVLALRRMSRQAKMFRQPVHGHKANVRQATRMMVMMCTVYLASNILDIVLQMFEKLGVRQVSTFPWLIQLLSDLVTIMSVMACATRLPIYMVYSDNFRHAVVSDLRKLFLCPPCFYLKHRMSSASVPTDIDDESDEEGQHRGHSVRRVTSRHRWTGNRSLRGELTPAMADTRQRMDSDAALSSLSRVSSDGRSKGSSAAPPRMDHLVIAIARHVGGRTIPMPGERHMRPSRSRISVRQESVNSNVTDRAPVSPDDEGGVDKCFGTTRNLPDIVISVNRHDKVEERRSADGLITYIERVRHCATPPNQQSDSSPVQPINEEHVYDRSTSHWTAANWRRQQEGVLMFDRCSDIVL